MEKSKLGNKQICESCGTRFFDFGKTEIKCPNCGHVKLQTKQLTHDKPEDEQCQILIHRKNLVGRE